jgi:DivIVA domain-containing protein
MPLTPEEIKKRAFSTGYGRGYVRSEVDTFLARVADDYAAIQNLATAVRGSRTAGAEGIGDAADDVAAEVGEVLRAARESAQRIRQKAQEGADGLLTAASKRAGELRAKAERAHSEAQEKADAKARHVVQEAEQRARELRASAERQHDELIGQAEKRHVVLMRYQEQLRDRIGTLEALIGEMQAQMDGVEEATARPRRPAQRRRAPRSEKDLEQQTEAGSKIVSKPLTAPVATDGETSSEPSEHTAKSPNS